MSVRHESTTTVSVSLFFIGCCSGIIPSNVRLECVPLIVVVFRAPVLTINPQRRRHGAHGRVLVDVLHAQPARRPAGFCRRHGIRVRTRVREA